MQLCGVAIPRHFQQLLLVQFVYIVVDCLEQLQQSCSLGGVVFFTGIWLAIVNFWELLDVINLIQEHFSFSTQQDVK